MKGQIRLELSYNITDQCEGLKRQNQRTNVRLLFQRFDVNHYYLDALYHDLLHFLHFSVLKVKT